MGEIDPRLAAEPGVRIIMQADCGLLDAARMVRADEVVVAPDDRRGMDLHRLLDDSDRSIRDAEDRLAQLERPPADLAEGAGEPAP